MAIRPDRKTVGTSSVTAAKLDKLAAVIKRLPHHRQQRATAMLAREVDDETELALQLKDAIRSSGATHYAIGKQAGIRPDLLDRFMRGERDLRLASAGKIARALGCKLSIPFATTKRRAK